ncbi:MAG TPA: glycosyltransferase family 39 protein [Solirubrobacteraceae bacterium]|jgi:4-amino-4-deoxy-L-arabinose transferase-like glycosyltransferase|nr:glycosyltransferase family 39 protein [Solirubrobacteraceae bacterium]
MSYSWQSNSAASASPANPSLTRSWTLRDRARTLAARVPRVELLGVMTLAAVLNLWALSRNGWANQYYAAAVKSMSGSWHDFLFASLDKGGLMTVDKPPLALWVEALSVRVFGFHPLSMLVPQALMGVASVALVYDLVRVRFGRVGGFVAGLALALTPITVAISRHNNPDALLILCSVAALWCVVRAFDRAGGRAGARASTRWLVAAGVCVGLGFETKMLVALVVVPGIAAAWLWVAPAARGRTLKGTGWHALRQLLAGGGAMLLVGGAWPLLVELTPASDRPWVSGTSDNRVLSLIFEYNGLGRVDGQAGGPPHGGAQAGGTASNMFGGATGPLRLLNSALGGQAGWLLGFALVSALGILAASRLRRGDARSGWLMAVGGAFATSAVLFSFASGILHPYYVSLLAPFAAALVGAGAAQLISGGVNVRVVGPLAVLAGVVVELVVRADYPGQLTWLPPLLIVVGVVAAVALVAFSSRSVRVAAVAAVLAALLAAPAVWAFDTLGHATSGTFPAGGPASVESGGPGGGPGGAGGFGRAGGGFGRAGGVSGRPGAGAAGFAGPGARAGGFGVPPSGAEGGPPSGAIGGPPSGVAGGSPSVRGLGGGGAIGAPMGGSVSASVESYVEQHGGGTIAVSSQSSAASAILDGYDNVAGIGGFSGRESEVSLSWLAQQVRAGKIAWVLDDEGTGAGASHAGGPAGETRVGAREAMAAAAKVCKAVTVSSGSSASGESAKLYDCSGDATALASAGTQQSRS